MDAGDAKTYRWCETVARLIIDSGEKEEVVLAAVKLGKEFDVQEIKIAGVRVGDFTDANMTFLAERKTIWDLASSLKTKRLQDQLWKMVELFEGPKFLIVEGGVSKSAKGNPDIRSYIYSVRGIVPHYNVHLIETMDTEDTISAVDWISREAYFKPGPVAKKAHAPAQTDPRLISLLAIKGLGLTNAMALMERHGSLAAIGAVAMEEDLRPFFVGKIGRKIAQKIIDHFTSQFKTSGAL